MNLYLRHHYFVY